MDIYTVIHRAARFRRDRHYISSSDPLVSLQYEQRRLRMQVADVVDLMWEADASGEMPRVVRHWAQLLEDALR